MKYCFGVDVGGTTVKLGLFTVEGELLDKWEIKTYTENEGERILPDVAEAIKGKIAEKLLKAEEICGIGVGVPHLQIKTEPLNVPQMSAGWQKKSKKNWKNSQVSHVLLEMMPTCLTLGEMWKGAEKEKKT